MLDEILFTLQSKQLLIPTLVYIYELNSRFLFGLWNNVLNLNNTVGRIPSKLGVVIIP